MSHGPQPAEVPNSTQTPNVFFTHLLAELSSAELRAYAYICYHTFGYGKDADAISYEQFLRGQVTSDGRVMDRGCGIKNRNTLSAALHSLEEKGLIVARHEHDEQGHRRATTFALVLTGQDTPLAQAVGAPEYQNRYSGQSTRTDTQAAKTDTLAPQSTRTDTQARVPKMIHTVPSRNKDGVGSTGAPRSDSKTVDDSARLARAREDLSRSSERSVDPRPDWVVPFAKRVLAHWGRSVDASDFEEWCQVLWERLENDTTSGREDAYSYLTSDDFLRSRNSPRGVKRALEEDLESWRAAGCPRDKRRKEVRRERTPAQPKVMTYKPPAARLTKDSPMEDILAKAADLRQRYGPQSAPYTNFLIGFELDREDTEQKLGATNGPASSV
jgi:hypothetical protein